jgi:hypothetical protein
MNSTNLIKFAVKIRFGTAIAILLGSRKGNAFWVLQNGKRIPVSLA